MVFVPDARVAFGGDLLWHQAMPNLIDASVTQWIETLNGLAQDRAEYTFVPGHGEVGTKDDVIMFRDYLSLVHKLVADVRAKRLSADALVTGVMPALIAQYGAWPAFKFMAPNNIRDVEAELNGTKKKPQPER